MRAGNKKKIMAVLVLFPLAIAAGYCALWFTQANIAKSEVEKLIKSLNNSGEIITYKSIKTEGFPTNLVVKIEKPSAQLPVSTLLKPFGQAMPIAPDGTDQAEMRKALLEVPEWVEHIALDGNIALTVNALSNTYHIESTGNYSGESNISGNKITYRFNLENGKRGCSFAFKHASNGSALKLWNWNYLSGDLEKTLQSLEKLECNAPATNLYLGESTIPGYSSEAFSITMENKGSGDNIDTRFSVDFPSYTATKEFDEVMEHYFKGLYPAEEMPTHYRMELLGKQSLKFEGNIALNKTSPESSPIKIQISDLSYVSDISESHSSFLLESNGLAAGGKISWDIQSNNSFKEAAYHNYLEQAGATAKSMYKNINTNDNPLKLDEASFVTQYQSLVPKLHELGKLSFSFTGNGEVKQGASMPLEVSALNVNAEPYGFEATGKGEIPSTISPIPTGEYKLNCRSCLTMVDDVTGWLQKLQPLLVEVDPESYWTSLSINAESVAGLKSFLQKLDPNGTENLSYLVKLDSTGNISINDKPLQEVLALYESEAGKLIQPSSSSADGSKDEEVSEAIKTPAVSAAPVTPITSEPAEPATN